MSLLLDQNGKAIPSCVIEPHFFRHRCFTCGAPLVAKLTSPNVGEDPQPCPRCKGAALSVPHLETIRNSIHAAGLEYGGAPLSLRCEVEFIWEWRQRYFGHPMARVAILADRLDVYIPTYSPQVDGVEVIN